MTPPSPSVCNNGLVRGMPGKRLPSAVANRPQRQQHRLQHHRLLLHLLQRPRLRLPAKIVSLGVQLIRTRGHRNVLGVKTATSATAAKHQHLPSRRIAEVSAMRTLSHGKLNVDNRWVETPRSRKSATNAQNARRFLAVVLKRQALIINLNFRVNFQSVNLGRTGRTFLIHRLLVIFGPLTTAAALNQLQH